MADGRRLHLGVDYGTAWSKLVLRDYTSPRGDEAFVLRPPMPVTAEAGDFRIPSMITSDGKRLWFGGAAAIRRGEKESSTHCSIKIRASLPGHFHGLRNPLPGGLSEFDLATLFVAFLLSIGRESGREYGLTQNAAVKTTFTLGVPATFSNNVDLRDLFARMARRASRLPDGGVRWATEGLRLSDAKRMLEVSDKSEAASIDPTQWIRNESVAGLHWGFRSPRIGEGLYSMIDVGAGTTNAAWFKVVANYVNGRWEKSGIAFFGCACRPPGVDLIDEEVLRLIGRGGDPAELRALEDQAIAKMDEGALSELEPIYEQIFKVSIEAFQSAYPKYGTQSAWDKSRLLLFGGGSRLRHLEPHLRQKPWLNMLNSPRFLDPGAPDDLMELGGKPLEGESLLLLVAYGLSILDGDVPEVTEARHVTNFSPWRSASPDLLNRITNEM